MTAPDPGPVDIAAERAVVLRLQAGDRGAAGPLFTWFSDKLYRQVILPRLPVRELAEDVLKDTFRIVLERIAQYHPEGNVSIFFWMRRIAINRAMDVHRAQARQRAFTDARPPEETAALTMSEAPPAPEVAPEQAETRAAVELSLSRLNPRYAEALRMRLLEDRTREECAAAMGVTVGNFDVILHRACKAFRQGYPP